MLQTALLDGLVQRPTDLLRLVVVPAFLWASWQDVQVRRVPNRLWPPLALLGVALLAVDAWHFHSLGGFQWQQFLIGTAISVLVVVPLAYVFWLLGGFGGADVKAIATLALLLPTFPTYFVADWALPLAEPPANAFALTVLTNAVVVGLLYPLSLGLGNLLRGDYSRWMLLGRRVRWDELPRAHGRLLEDPDGFTRDGLDVDALRMYLRWRGIDLSDLRERPDELRDPASLPDEPNPPTDGAIDRGADGVLADGGPDEARPAVETEGDGGAASGDADAAVGAGDADAVAAGDDAAGAAEDGDEATGVAADDATGEDDVEHGDGTADVDDPWGAAAFLADVEHGAYGTSAATLRDGLEVVARREQVWLSPGVPFIVPVFVGLLVALTYGDVLFGLLESLGVV